MTDSEDIVSIKQIAERLGLSHRTITQYGWGTRAERPEGPGTHNVGFPAEDLNIDGKPLWKWVNVERWARETGRGKPVSALADVK